YPYHHALPSFPTRRSSDLRIGIPVAIHLEHLDARRVDLVDVPRQIEAQQPRAPVQPLGVLGELQDLAIVGALTLEHAAGIMQRVDRKSTRLNSSHLGISYA